jgi:hypothetical protein
MRRHLAISIFAVFSLALLTTAADDFWVKKDWKQWTVSDCKKLLESSPWVVRKMVENESNVNRLPSAANGANADTALNKDAGEVNYIVQIRSAAPIRHALIRLEQIEKQYDKMTDADKKAFDAQMEELYGEPDEAIIVHVKYSGTRDLLAADISKSWKSIPRDTVPAEMFLIASNGSKARPLTFVADSKGGDEFELTFPRSALGQGFKSFKLQIPHPALGDFGGSKVMVEFKLDKMMFDGKPSF